MNRRPHRLALLGTDHDEHTAAQVGRAVVTVRRKRRELGISAFEDRQGRKPATAGCDSGSPIG
jgi:hypothetical protein